MPFGRQVESFADTSNPSTATFGVVGLLMTLISATSFARALGRMYARCWDVPVVKMRQAWWRWVMVLFAVILAIVMIAAAHLAVRLPIGGHVLDYALGFVIWTLLWAYLPHLFDARPLAAADSADRRFADRTRAVFAALRRGGRDAAGRRRRCRSSGFSGWCSP